MTTTDVTTQSTCPICGDDLSKSALPDYQRCRRCGHQVYSGMTEGGPVTNQAPLTTASGKPSGLQRDQTRVVRSECDGRVNVVDIGCGDGGFLSALAQSRGPAFGQLVGVEVDPDSVEQARAVRGLTVVESISDLDDEYGVATAWHSAEHFPIAELHDQLGHLRPRLGKNGRVMVSVPNGASLQQRVFGHRWAFHDDPNHRSVFTPTSLDALMRAAGYERVTNVRVARYGLFAAIQSSFNVFIRPHNALYLGLKRGTLRLDRSLVLRHLVFSPLAMALALPFAVAELRSTLAASLNVWYRPRTQGDSSGPRSDRG